MRKLLPLLLLPLGLSAQEILWEKSLGGRHAEYLTDLQPTADYGFIIGGSSLSMKSGNKTDPGSGDLDYWIWKMDEHGSAEWQKSFGGGASDLLQSIKTTHDGGFLLAGTSNSSKGYQKAVEGHGGNDYWVIKLNAKGDQMWQKCFGGIGQDDLQTVVVTRDGGYLLAGTSNSSAPAKNQTAVEGTKKEKTRGNTDYWIIKIDADGNEQWQKTYGGQYADQLRDVEQTKDGGFIVAGYSNSPTSGEKLQENFGQGGDFWILKLDDKGNIEWQQAIGGAHDDQPYAIRQTADLGYMVAGSSNSQTRTSKKGTDLWVVKLGETGETLWEEAYDIGSVDILTSLIENQDGSLLIGAYSPISSGDEQGKEGLNDYMAIKISEKGEELWRKSIGSEGEDILRKVVMSRDGGYLMAGTSNPEFKGFAHRRQQKKKGLVDGLNPLDSSQQLAGAQKAQQELDTMVNDTASQVNEAVAGQLDSATKGINDALGNNNDSGFKLGANSPVGNLLNPTNSGGGNGGSQGGAVPMENLGPKPGAKISRDKKQNYGGKDFWVVKIKDKEKPVKEKLKIEAIPNPVMSYTNVIVGFDFDTGTARLYDIGGRELQKFAIDSRTVPVNLSGYPVGVYIVNIQTNKGEGSVKVIKNDN
ncbi:T9SS type A sorting domain-containing protein [Flavobacterium soli]|uniref:T9SS type A sorting domain-containing protein n=1 Tax=Flavobacterium soli TaxID=344881 RepID=UPI0003FB4C11|nr:T9SS type A sorting domain-containing protein [Flavobacterium soli]